MKFYQKTWFVILALVIFSPLGIYLMFRYKSWVKPAKIILVSISLFIFIPTIVAAFSNKPQIDTTDIAAVSTEVSASPIDATIAPSISPSTEITSTPKSSPKPTPSKTPISDKTKITKAVRDEFGNENYISVQYTEETNFVLIKARGIDSMTSKMTVRGMYLSMSNVLKNLDDLNDIDIAFNIVYPLQDKYGNSTDTIVIKATYNHTSREMINWDRFLLDNLPAIADEWWMHDTLISAME